MDTSKLKTDLANNIIKIKLDDDCKTVPLVKYCKVKSGDLSNFGYSGLTSESIKKALNRIANNNQTDVIDFFIIDDLDY